MNSHRLAVLAAALLVAAPTASQAQSSFAPMVSANLPMGTFSDAYKTGWGLGAQFTKGNGLLTFVAEAGYNAFSRDSAGTFGEFTDDLGVWNFAPGCGGRWDHSMSAGWRATSPKLTSSTSCRSSASTS